MNGSLSYHVSFCLRYEHTPADFYFIALLQKILAPKEFSAQRAQAGKGAGEAPISVLDAETGVFPLDKVLVRRLGEAAAPDPLVPFWHYVRRCFDAHAKDLFDSFGIRILDARGRTTSDYFSTLIATDPFIEVPKLQMPRGRFLFLFDDKRLFRDLLPLPGEDGRRRSRRDFVKDAHYEPFKDWITREADRAKAEGGKAVALTEVALRDIHENAHDELRYLFLSGFIQNIIDFLNQDASEVVDGTDPVYPATAEQEEESFFVRYTNQRSITQFVPGSRSLKTGKDFIGTCPYVFLVHLLAMHNEFLVRDYERQTEALTTDIERFNEEARLSRAADRFYAFRTNDYTKHQKYKYANVFRYDTERDLFEAVEARRGTHRKEQYLDSIVSNLEAQTRDLEGRLRAKVDRQFSLLLAAVGIFSVLQVLYQVLDISTRGLETVSSKPVDMVDFTDVGTAQMMAKYLFLSTGGFLLLTAALTLWVLRKLILRR
jgi:hypothetical protein